MPSKRRVWRPLSSILRFATRQRTDCNDLQWYIQVAYLHTCMHTYDTRNTSSIYYMMCANHWISSCVERVYRNVFTNVKLAKRVVHVEESLKTLMSSKDIDSIMESLSFFLGRNHEAQTTPQHIPSLCSSASSWTRPRSSKCSIALASQAFSLFSISKHVATIIDEVVRTPTWQKKQKIAKAWQKQSTGRCILFLGWCASSLKTTPHGCSSHERHPKTIIPSEPWVWHHQQFALSE